VVVKKGKKSGTPYRATLTPGKGGGKRSLYTLRGLKTQTNAVWEKFACRNKNEEPALNVHGTKANPPGVETIQYAKFPKVEKGPERRPSQLLKGTHGRLPLRKGQNKKSLGKMLGMG